MKKITLIAMAVFALAMTSCVKSIPEIINLTGRVVDESNNPVSGANVSIVCDAATNGSCVTGGDGRFSLDLDINNIGNSNFLSVYANDKASACELNGVIGESSFNFNDVVIKTLKTFVYDGITYEVYPTDLGPAEWEEANRTAGDLVFAGHDDWGLPGRWELDAMYKNRNAIGCIGARYWSGTEDSYYHGYYLYVDFNNGKCDDEYSSYEYYYRPIRIKL